MAQDMPHTGIGSAILTLAALAATAGKGARKRYRTWRTQKGHDLRHARLPRY